MTREGAKVKEKRGFPERYYLTSHPDGGHETTFADGDDVGLPLPDEIAFPVDTAVMIERSGDVLRIWPRASPPLDAPDSERADI